MLSTEIQKGNKMDETTIFKCFLREQLEIQKKLEKSINEKDFEKAKYLIAKMIDRTQRGIEEN
jgi:hypothetical protein